MAVEATDVQEAVGIQAGALREALRVVGAAQDPDLPNLSGIRVAAEDGALWLDGTNLEWSVQVLLPWQGPAIQARMVDGRTLERLAASWNASARVTLEPHADGLVLRTDSTRVRLATASPDEWPTPPEVPEVAPTAAVEAQDLARSLRRVLPIPSPRAWMSRPLLGSIRIEVEEQAGLTVVATDSARLHYDRLGGLRATGQGGVMLPASSVQGLLRVLDAAPPKAPATLWLGERQAFVEVGTYRYWTRLVEAGFPPYGHVLADGPVRVTLPVRPLAASVERLALLASSDRPAVVSLSAGEDGTMIIRSAAADRGDGEERLEVLDGQWPADLVLHYQARFVRDALACADGEAVHLSVDPPSGRAVLSEGGRPWRAVMMSWRTI